MSTKDNRRNIAATAAGIATGMFVMGFAAGVVTDAYFTPRELTVIDDIQRPAEVHSLYELHDAEQEENSAIERAVLENANVIDNCTVTYYCAEEYPHICGWGLGVTATGEKCDPGHMVAVDKSVIPLHSQVILDYGDGDLHYYFAEDVGGAVKGNHVDVMCETHAEALSCGKRTATVYWIGPEDEQ